MPQQSRGTRIAGRGVVVAGMVAFVVIGFRIALPDGVDPLVARPLAIAWGIATGLLLRWLVRRNDGRRIGTMLAGAVAIVACATAGRQLHRMWRTEAEWPILPETARATDINAMASSLQASWAARVAAHVLADSADADVVPSIPVDWPYPEGAQLAVERGDDGGLRVWARTPDGLTDCQVVRQGRTSGPEPSFACPGSPAGPPDLPFAAPRRGQWTASVDPDSAVGAPWSQHRNDATRSGTALVNPEAMSGWVTSVDGGVRSSASIVGDYVLVGSHGTGSITAIDRRTGAVRWTRRAPNWVHQDIVSDGAVALVGFGDNSTSFTGRMPSGVAAYSVANGRHLWTGFDESSVMTSPAVVDSTIVYASATGVLRKRSIRTGEVLASKTLPGGVIMGPPAVVGDTIVFTLDEARACAVLVSSFRTVWCRTLPGMRMLGHAAPSVADGLVLVSGPARLAAASWDDLRQLPRRHVLRVIVTALSPEQRYAGQSLMGLSIRDGATRWRTRLFPATRGVEGHSSGTAAVSGGVGAIVLPFTDSVVAFRLSTGAVLWTAPGRQSRGAPLLIGDRVVIAGRDGVVEIRRVATGTLECTLRRVIGYDRAGPALAGSLLIFADLDGRVEAIPRATIVGCRS